MKMQIWYAQLSYAHPLCFSLLLKIYLSWSLAKGAIHWLHQANILGAYYVGSILDIGNPRLQLSQKM